MQEHANQAIENNEVIVDQPIEETPTEEVEAPQAEDLVEDNAEEEKEEVVEGEEEDTPFPKKATRALERRNKKINKLRAEKAELEEKLAKYANNPEPKEQQIDNNPVDGLVEPQEDDFEDYASYLEAKGEYKVRKEYAAKEAQAQQHREFESQQRWVQERAQYVDDRAAKAAEALPELNGLYMENQDVIEGYSHATKLAFLEAEKPEMAFYALASEGKLESLDSMSPTMVAREIAFAEIRGEKLAKGRPQSKAPAPIKTAKGTGTRRKVLDDMSPSELLEHLRKNK